MPDNLRAEFPFFAANPNLVYLDSAATSLKPQRVIDALLRYNARESVNIHRGVYRLSQRATDTVEEVRGRTAAFLAGEKNRTAVFTKGTTEAFNLLAHILTSRESQLAEFFPAFADKKTPAIVLSRSEHHANIVPWQVAAARCGHKIFYVPVDADGNFAASAEILSEIAATHSVRVVSLSMQSNVTGIIHDLAPFREWASKNGAAFAVDAAQAAVHVAADIRRLNPDFTAFSAHKIFGATGVGALVAAKDVLDQAAAYQTGGGMISLVEEEKSTYLDAPAKYEAGTQAVGEIYALGAALDFAEKNRAAIEAADRELLDYADEKLSGAGVKIFGKTAKGRSPAVAVRSPIYSFEIPGVHAHDVGTLLDEQDICIRAGHHCCQLLMRALGVTATARASFLVYNTRDDVDRLVQGIAYVKKIFRK